MSVVCGIIDNKKSVYSTRAWKGNWNDCRIAKNDTVGFSGEGGLYGISARL